MRNLNIATFMALLFICLSLSPLVASPFSEAVSVITVSPSQTQIYFTLPEIEMVEYAYQKLSFAKIEIEGAFASAEAGLPNLPHFSATLAVPIGSKPAFEGVALSTPRYMPTLPIAPVQNVETESHTFQYNTSFYQSQNQNTVYPQTSYFMSDVQTLRDYQFITVKIYPIKYIPAQGCIEIIDSFQFTINHQTRSANPQYTLRPFISKPFERIYVHTFQNYHQVRSPNPVYQQQSILLIYGGESSVHNPTFMGYLDNMVNLKKQKGFVVTVVSAISIGTTTTAIKSYIQDLYDNSPNPPEWIILLGNYGAYPVPAYGATFLGYTGTSDYPYTFLAGNDYIGDAFIGRIPSINQNQVYNYWQKIQKYELNTPPTDSSLYKKALLVGHSAVSGVSTYIINRYIKSLIINYDPTANIQEMYYNNSQTATLHNNFNTGHNIFNFRGWSGMDNFSVSNLTNTNILTNCVVLTCQTGAYSNGITPQLIAHSYNGSPAGAILATGIHTLHTETEYNNAEDGAIFYAMYVMDVATMGEALLYGKIFTNIVYPDNDQTNATIHWTNLMGDPSLYIFKTAPKTFTTALPTTFPSGTQGFRFEVTDEEENNIAGAWVTISKADGSYVSKAVSDALGVAFLPFDHQQTGSFIFAISKPGFHVKRTSANITGNNSITVINNEISDPAPGGNNSQTINPAETINLSITVKNFTSSDATNLSVTISTESEFVTLLTDPIVTLGSIGAGLDALYSDAFTFMVSPLAPDKDLLPFTFVITDGSTSWTSYLLLEVKGIDLQVENINPEYLNIGSNTDLAFTIKNVGTIPSGTLQAELISHSAYLTVTQEIVTILNIDDGASITQSTPFSVYVSTASIAGMRLKADIHLFNVTGFTMNIPVDLPVGNKEVGDPTGPDDYGYIIYHNQDTNIIERPIYNWINIANIGTNTGMADVSAGQEEDSRLIMLPFLAGFYGQLYDRITICSNGWIVFGVTEQKDFRNLPLPGPVAPRPLIAPYWTDLVVGGAFGGGVYTYHSQSEQAFIVQFDKVKWVTGYSGGSGFITSADSVSFQVLIYDPMYNSTALGDSKIKIQYHRFHPGIPGDIDNPFQYITVGIQDHTAQNGLQYVYNNVYSLGSNTLSNGSALLITSPNIFSPDSPYLGFSQVVNPETGTNTVDIGSTSHLYVSVVNETAFTVENITFTLTTTSTDVELLVSERFIPSIAGNTIYTIPEPFSMVVSDHVTDQTLVPISMTATTETQHFQLYFYVLINAPKLEMTGMQMRNSASVVVNNYQPGDDGSIDINFQNTGHLPTSSGMLHFTSLSYLLSLDNTETRVPSLEPNEVATLTTNIHISNTSPTVTVLPISYFIDAAQESQSGLLYIPVGQTVEGFESGNLTAIPWNIETTRPWTVVNTSPSSGTFCAQSSIDITSNQSSILQIAWLTSSAGTIQFDYKVSSEEGHDFLKFYINDVLIEQWSGNLTTWQTVSYPVSAGGVNVFKWEYSKDLYTSSGYDRAWIDNIVFPTSVGGGNINSPLLYVSIEEINLDLVEINDDVTTTFTIANLGNVTLTGTITPPEFCSIDCDTNISLLPLSTKDIVVTIRSDEPGQYNGNITIASNASNHPVINIPVSVVVSDSDDDHTLTPTITILRTNYPNPFNPSTTITFDIARKGLVYIEIFNIKGQLVKTLANSVYDVGTHSVIWNGDDAFGKAVSSGIYFYRMRAEKYASVKKMLMIK